MSNEQEEIMPIGYRDWMECLKRPDSWDVKGIILDARNNVRMDASVQRGKVLAVIDFLLDGQSQDLIRELVVACKIGLSSLRHSGIAGRSAETDTLEAAIKRAENVAYRLTAVE